MRLSVPVPDTFYKIPGANISTQQLVNLQVMPVNMADGKVQYYLLGNSGLREFVDFGANVPVWGMAVFNDLLYAVVGNDVYTITSSGVKTNLGSLGTISAPVMFENNILDLVILKPDGDLWKVTPTSLTQIVDPLYLASSSIAQAYGYFILPIKDSNEYQLSDIDAVTFPGNIERADANPDYIVRAIQNNGEVWLYGSYTTEVWQFIGQGDVLFGRVTVLSRGASAKLGFAQEDDRLFWLADDRKIYQSTGYKYVPISNECIEAEIAQYDVVSDCIMWTYTDGGQKMLTCQFPSEGVTWECKINTGSWNKRQSKDETRWRTNCFVKAFGKNLFGDFKNGKIYEMAFDATKEGEDYIPRSFTLPYFFNLDKKYSFDRIELDIESGTANVNNPGAFPQAFLSWSDDYGHTFSNQYPTTLGGQGQYNLRVMWIGKGAAARRCFKFDFNDPIKIRIGQVIFDVEEFEA